MNINPDQERDPKGLIYLLGLGTVPFFNYALAEYSQNDYNKSRGYVWKGPDKIAMFTMEIFRLGLLTLGILDTNLGFTAGWLAAGVIETMLLARYWVELPEK